MNVALTAGGRIAGLYAEEAGTTVKALVSVRDETMLARVIAAARGAGAEQIAVVGGSEVRRACGADVDVVIGESASGAENLLQALRIWPDDEPLLLMTTDLPYIDARSLRAFIEAAPSGMLSMPIATTAAFDARFPDAPPYGITLGGERVVNGGAFLFPAGSAEMAATVATQFFDARKSPWRMASMLGLSLALRFATGRLSIAALEREAERRLKVPTRAVRNAPPELCFDADRVEEYRYANARP